MRFILLSGLCRVVNFVESLHISYWSFATAQRYIQRWTAASGLVFFSLQCYREKKRLILRTSSPLNMALKLLDSERANIKNRQAAVGKERQD